MEIKATDVAKLRQMTGAGMMDCKSALVEANGDFERAKEIIREKGKLVAAKRADRETTEGAVIAKANENNTNAILTCLGCETDFVAKNAEFQKLANEIADVALANMPADLAALKALNLNGMKSKRLLFNKLEKAVKNTLFLSTIRLRLHISLLIFTLMENLLLS